MKGAGWFAGRVSVPSGEFKLIIGDNLSALSDSDEEMKGGVKLH